MKIFKYVFIVGLFFQYGNLFAQKNFAIEADAKFANEAYYSAIDLYKKAEVRANKNQLVAEKARINYQIAECYRLNVEPEQAQTYYNRSILLNHHQKEPLVLLRLAEVLMEQGEYSEAKVNLKSYIEVSPQNQHAKDLLASCDIAVEWTESPTNHEIKNLYQINGPYYDYSPTFKDKQHKEVIFVSSRDPSSETDSDDDEAKAGDDPRTGGFFMDLWYSRIDNNGKWGPPQLLPGGINTPDNEGSAVLSKKGDKIFFTRCPREKKVDLGCEIFYSDLKGTNWSKAEKIQLKPEGADSLSCGHPAINSSANFMIFSADFPGGFGGKDLWYSEYDKREDSWLEPVNLGAKINTANDEMFPYLSDDESLYFSSDGYIGLGGLDIFRAEKITDKEWDNVENLKFPFNSPEHDFGITFENGKDARGYFSSSRKSMRYNKIDYPGTKGKDDLFSFNKIIQSFILDVYVLDKETGEPINGATIKLTGIDTNQVGGIVSDYVKTSNVEGRYKFDEISPGKRYILKNLLYEIEVEADNYLSARGQQSTYLAENDNVSKYWPIEIFLQPVVTESGEALVIDFPEVQYAFAKSELLVDERINSKDSLDYLYTTLVENPSIIIELQAHTDCRGSDASNKKLSQRRAQSCVDYLISKGIPKERMVPVGYGEDVPRAEGLECSSISKLSTKEEQEAAHQKNRRTQFRVLSFDYKSPAKKEE